MSEELDAARLAVVEAARRWYRFDRNAEAPLAAAMQHLLTLEKTENDE